MLMYAGHFSSRQGFLKFKGIGPFHLLKFSVLQEMCMNSFLVGFVHVLEKVHEAFLGISQGQNCYVAMDREIYLHITSTVIADGGLYSLLGASSRAHEGCHSMLTNVHYLCAVL